MTRSPMKHHLLSRRSLVRNAGLAALLLPVLRRMDAQAQSATSPRRVILFYSPNGAMNETGPAYGSETDFTLHDWWSPLERHKDIGIFMSHLASTGAGVVDGNGHGLGGQTFGGWGAGAEGDQYAQNGPTIDQLIARRLSDEGRAGVRPSVVWGNYAVSEAGGTGDAFATDAARNIRPTTSPRQAWAELFSSFVAPETDAAAIARAQHLIDQRRSALDFALADCTGLRDSLGAEGMRMLDEHCTTLRSIEENLNTQLATGGDCKVPAEPGDIYWQDPENIDAQTDAFVELIGMTLSCELSHTIAYQVGAQGARNRLASSYGVPSSPQADSGDSGPAHHPWTHQTLNSEPAREAFQKFTTHYANQMALLLDKLRATKDTSGNALIDSTVVLWLSEFGGNSGNGDFHQTSNTPAMLFGNGQGTFNVGRYLRGSSPDSDYGSGYVEAGRQSAQLLLACTQYMGLPENTIGATGINGPWDALYA